jgi:hypothetical protein
MPILYFTAIKQLHLKKSKKTGIGAPKETQKQFSRVWYLFKKVVEFSRMYTWILDTC